ncbi:alanyl-tRNA synthetase [Perkinsela sp. CCAP 1560/4]|nr:alanyl-tRNA synthetase [Perkinsela sp. CCAP 1560/4]KNH08269.1 alanyl-tRNA synthetase [Perkinsela sp. CCAP 1560/4]|eukprot:KNH06967.1 alanyl-tRNA synthetase [Perkinsela sp. CCAP 1560/4]
MQAPFWSGNKVRETFLNYFIEEHGHTLVPPSKVVPEKDPTLLFTNAGMNQFKDRFLGKASAEVGLKNVRRAVNSQKCIRAGGKHNDLEDVGRDTYHHTFFEMLGSWSFDDYFKHEAIPMAWGLLTKKFGIDANRLYVTVFEGNTSQGLPEDSESRGIWEKLLPSERILFGDMKDNFWEMGDTGPCGRCTEIHYDMVGGRDASSLVNKDDPTVVELWNLVFVEYNRESDASLRPLPVKHVDTGMGLERLVAVLQNKTSNYDTDLWLPLFQRIQNTTGFPISYEEDTSKDRKGTLDTNIAYRVVADHIRTLTVAITDGAVPDATGRGYVLRRIVRRAIRFAQEFLQAPEGFLLPLVDGVNASLGNHFPELRDENNLRRVKALLHEEETAFNRTYKKGMQHFIQLLDRLSLEKCKTSHGISGTDAFILHDRYGFPVDLTLLMAKEKGVAVDIDGFEKEKLRVKSENAEKKDSKKDFLDSYAMYYLQDNAVAHTVDETKFFAEGTAVSVGEVLQMYSHKDKEWRQEVTGDTGLVGIILDLTSFYAEAGGQTYDTGRLIHSSDESSVFVVQEVHKFSGYVVHIGIVTSGTISKGDRLRCQVDEDRRKGTRSNHTMTHLLNHRLRETLQYGHPEKCVEVHQKGSFVGSNLLRFDFSWNEKISLHDLELLESRMKNDIEKKLTVFSKEVDIDIALKIASLRAMFDEKYGKTVRLVTIGISFEEVETDPENLEKLKNYSIELCGGTHVASTASINDVVIQSEEALTKGVRRIVCLTGPEASQAKTRGKEFEDAFRSIRKSASLDSSFEAISSSIATNSKALSKLRDEVNASSIPLITKMKLREEINAAIEQSVADKKVVLAQMLREVALAGESIVGSLDTNAKYVVQEIVNTFGVNRDAIVKLHDTIQNARGDAPIMVVLYCQSSSTGMVLASSPIPNDINAAQWVKHAVGKGGGKPTLAQSGFQGELEPVLRRAHEKAAECLRIGVE